MSTHTIPSTTPPIGAMQGRLIVGIIVVTLVLLVIVIADLARGGRPDPPELRAAAALLDGPWRFHTGDDPRWARADFDDRQWQTIDLTALPGSHDGDVGLPDYIGGWMAHGHPGYRGYAWYRRAVTVPAWEAEWDILGPTLVEDGYELYWNDQRLGGSGRIGAKPRLVGTRPLRFALPGTPAGTRGILAIRTYMLPADGSSADGGGIHSAPILAPRPIAEALHRVQWQRTIAGYIVDAIEPLAILALVMLALAYLPRSCRKGFVVFACVALALTAARRLSNAIISWTDLIDLTTYVWMASLMWVPTLAAWTLAWNRWCGRPWRSIDVAAVLLAVAQTIGSVTDSADVTVASRVGSIVLFVALGARIFRGGPMRVLALATLALIVAVLFGGELLDPLGVPGIWFPFGIGVSRTQYLFVATIPLLACLIVRTLEQKNGATISPSVATGA